MINIWAFEGREHGYTVQEVEHDYDLHAFEVYQLGELVHTITPSDIESMQQIIADLNQGYGVNGYEDGMGNTISI